jgi:molybdopterin-guanine dinucleotide biosynthesis protein A
VPGAAAAGPAGGFDAIVLAGGRGRRVGGAGKPGLLVAGRPLVAWVVAAAVAAGARRVVLVGPPWPRLLTGQPQPPGGLASVREQPPGSGPVPALRRGLAEVAAPAVALLAADLPFLRSHHVGLLLAAATAAAAPAGAAGQPGGAAPAGAVMTDEAGRPQWLTGCWRSAPLAAALQAYDGDSLRGLLGPLAPVLLRYDLAVGEPPPWLDCDTPGDVRRAREWQAAAGRGHSPGTTTGKDGTPVSTLEQWLQAACAELGLDPAAVDVRAVLDLARDVAHGVDRPAAPVTAYLLGVAVGRGLPAADAVTRLTGLARSWAALQQPEGDQPTA